MSELSALRTLGSSGVPVSSLGLGCAPLGNLYTEVADADAQATITGAFDAGLRYFDVAPLYGHGLAERRLGEGLASAPRDGYTLSTKVGRLVRPVAASREAGAEGLGEFEIDRGSTVVFDYSGDGVRRSLDESLSRLGVGRIDIALIHDPDDHVDQALGEAYPALRRMREEGVIRAIGVGMNVSDIPARFVAEADIDCVLLAGRYTLLDQTGLVDLLPAAAERGVSIIIGGVYNSGILAGPIAGAKFDYRPASPELLARAARLDEVCGRHDVPLKAAAIQFPFGHPAVATVLTGARSVAELRENVAAQQRPIPVELWRDLVDEKLIPAASVDGFGA
jgi:D-threo-aldose 1-dehydrogenase